MINAIDSQLFATSGEMFNSLKLQMWNTLDEEIGLGDCDIYRYVFPKLITVESLVQLKEDLLFDYRYLDRQPLR